MKTRKKGILFFAVVAGIMLTSAVTLAVNPAQWLDDSSDFDEITAEELDAFDLDALGLDLELGYSGDQLSQFCSANELAGSNEHVKEYKIPTACTQPLAITVDHNGIVWFAQTNTGKVAKFDPLTETFTEYDNSVWKNVEKIFIATAIENNVEPTKLRSMMWGIDYFPDGSVWFTDEATDAIWKFSIDDESYNRISYSQTDESKSSLPQKLVIEGSKIIINDFTGGRLSFLDYAQNEQGLLHYAIPSVMENAVTSDFAIDSDKNVWYTNWVPSGQGILVKFDYPAYEFQSAQGEVTQGLLLQDFVEWYNFPAGLTTPNGVAVGPEQKIWLADTSSNYFFSFDPKIEEFTKYVTSIPTIDSYGNASGFIKNPVSRPYWIEHSDGNLIMNEHNANRIGVFNPSSETLVEYTVPSRNPNWQDCAGIDNCGLAQVFDFAVAGEKIWFTEWVENNIGVVDTSIPLPFSIVIDKDKITLEKGQTTQITLEVTKTGSANMYDASVNSSLTSTFSDIIITHENNFSLSDKTTISVEIMVSEHALSGTHKVLLGAYTDDIAVSQFITVTVM
uniref:Streptogramin lyase n=4 Tax=environmental samples TaxID=651140 RepID=A0A075H3J3_9ARCH|nr:Streptogramin lyase [uncultured marine thaumarchaeote KM3_162_H04]AIF08458.1 Streptogramin lyase [uncultured marine thaumarchaeote KM3_30_B02]AIF08468.1 Streptogramin lyase [uncultured marine thaumarchaeote KM3_30_B03]AIF18935.1 Streptogramin lyase [uncultured marine thaumarchaeote KM3_85_A07]